MAIYHGCYNIVGDYEIDYETYDKWRNEAILLFQNEWNTDAHADDRKLSDSQTYYNNYLNIFISRYVNEKTLRDKAKYDRWHKADAIRKERKKRRNEEKKKRWEKYQQTPEYRNKVQEEKKKIEALSNDVVKFIINGDITEVYIKNYNNSNYTNLNTFFNLIFDDIFWPFYNKYVKFTNDALGFAVLLFIGEVLFNIIPGLMGNRSGTWFVIDLLLPVGIFIYWYYKGMEERYKLGWLIYLRNNWYVNANDQQRAAILIAIKLAGTTSEAQRYMMANVNERFGINPQPPNTINQVLINDNIWKKVNKKGRTIYEG